MNKIKMGVAGITLAALATFGFGTLPAFADDVVPDPAPVVEVPVPEEVAPVTEPPAEEFIPDQPVVVEETTAAVEETPQPESDQIVVGAIAAPQTGKLNTINTDETKTLTWKMVGSTGPNDVTWPQLPADPNALECGVWYQQDTYKYGSEKLKAIVDAFDDDGVLSNGEDWDVVLSWVFIYGGDCVPEPVIAKVDFGITPATCTAGQILVEGETSNASWNADAIAAWGTEGPANYDISATADKGAVGDQFVDGIAHFTGSLTGPDISLCDPPNHIVKTWSYCGGWGAKLKNPSTSDEVQLTASYVVRVNGQFFGAYAVLEDAKEVIGDSYAEDFNGGSVHVRIEAGSAQGGAILAEFDVDTDCIPPQPEDYSTYTEWTDGDYLCDATSVEQTRTRIDHTFTLIEGQWVDQASDPMIETQSRDLTDEEKAANICPLPPVIVPPVVQHLATTGSDPTNLMLGAGMLLAAGAGAVLIQRRRKVQE